MANSIITKEEYSAQLKELNPPPAVGNAIEFKETYQSLIAAIREINNDAKIIVSAIIPRLWDHNRRHLVRNSYNSILHSLTSPKDVFYAPSFRPFFDKNQNLREELFDWDGLHLNQKGAVVLRTYLCDRIDKALKGTLKKF